MPRNPIVLTRELLGTTPADVEPLVMWSDRATHRVTIGSERFVVKTDDDRETVAREVAGQRRAATAGVRVPEIIAAVDDALHRAKLSPYASLKSLTPEERERLLAAIIEVLDEGLERERGRTGGLSANKLGEHFTVHGKAGVPCPVCGDDLKRVSYESHEVVYCPRCQTGGKVLADRRLSRLVK